NTVKVPVIEVAYSNSPTPMTLKISYDAKISPKGIFNVIRTVYKYDDPAEGINARIKQEVLGFIFDHGDFVREQTKHLPAIEELIKTTGQKCGFELQKI